MQEFTPNLRIFQKFPWGPTAICYDGIENLWPNLKWKVFTKQNGVSFGTDNLRL